ncbi:MAG: c-type cytochrome [Dehalococcoidia bacterium]|nr:c-type cytochrome [Dehalococcoidia bacterium]
MLGDWLHLMAVGAWAGALPSLLLSVVVVARRTEGVQRARLLAMLVSGFSDVALAAAAVVALTGAFGSYLHVGGFAGVASGYGATLVVKTALFLGVLAAAGVNLLVVRPRLRALAADPASSTFPKTLGLLRRALVAEVALVACVVVASALLTSLDTARRPEGPDNQGRVAAFQRQSGDRALSLQVAYIGGGLHRLTREAKDRSGPVADSERAVARVTYLIRDVGESEVVLQRRGDEYAAQGLLLPLAGAWQIELLPLRPGPAAAPERFQVTVVASGLVYPALAETAQSPPNRAVPLALAGALLLVALAAVFRGGMLPRRKRRQAVALVIEGACAGVVGIAALVGQGNAIRNGASVPLVNPFPATPQSVAAGEALYRQHCVACHCTSGHGDGPAAAGLSPPPADLPVHVPLHSDRQLFVWISNGLPGTAMPVFRDKLTAGERWDLLNYLKRFAP